MQRDDLRLQFEDARERQDWIRILEVGNRLHTLGDYGDPSGTHAYWMEMAAGRLGRRFEAVFHSRTGLAKVAAGSLLEAGLLCNGCYSSRLYGAPSRALELGSTYLIRYEDYPRKAQSLRGWVIFHMGGAHDDRGDFPAAIARYQQALEHALEQGDEPLRAMGAVDLALAMLKRRGAEALPEAAAMVRTVNPDSLSGRARFAALAVQAEIQHSGGDFDGSMLTIEQARQASESVDEALARERAMLALLEARNLFGLGNRHSAFVMGLRAVAQFEGINDERHLSQCEEFLRSVLGQPS